ncbi:single-strand DNA-binding protein [Chitinophaga costaii]|uniref:Single-stranded DNA-binding protein n=1 Tax=Chitinophaga costaii TaxID=1335309 RepID=A0A1C4D8I3_9BACT|nr:single-stranded DNA-binding protein [Chitinophaga costaii]PUZ24505.1 single-stranded DNA-binding protein [Chitinophaga costaii]SCC27647.1 single-strand DNA-binding protein [Chitinophaga costaii]
MIKLQMIGHLGRNAIRGQVNGKSVLNFSLAHTERFKNFQGEDMQRTTWAECSLWEREALAPYLQQGSYVYVEGIPHLDTYTNKKGETVTSLRLRVTTVQLLSKREATEANAVIPDTGTEVSVETAVHAGTDTVEELPF